MEWCCCVIKGVMLSWHKRSDIIVILKEYCHYIELCDQVSIKYSYMCSAVELSSGIPTHIYVVNVVNYLEVCHLRCAKLIIRVLQCICMYIHIIHCNIINVVTYFHSIQISHIFDNYVLRTSHPLWYMCAFSETAILTCPT
jgi:hypothetical protein